MAGYADCLAAFGARARLRARARRGDLVRCGARVSSSGVATPRSRRHWFWCPRTPGGEGRCPPTWSINASNRPSACRTCLPTSRRGTAPDDVLRIGAPSRCRRLRGSHAGVPSGRPPGDGTSVGRRPPCRAPDRSGPGLVGARRERRAITAARGRGPSHGDARRPTRRPARAGHMCNIDSVRAVQPGRAQVPDERSRLTDQNGRPARPARPRAGSIPNGVAAREPTSRIARDPGAGSRHSRSRIRLHRTGLCRNKKAATSCQMADPPGEVRTASTRIGTTADPSTEEALWVSSERSPGG